MLFMLTFGNVGYAGYHTYQLHQKMKKLNWKKRKVQAILTLLNSLTSQFYDASWQYIPDGEFRLSGTSKQQVTVDSLQVYSIDTKVLGIEVENAIKRYLSHASRPLSLVMIIYLLS
ncbi:MAG: hypothetical protein HWD59_09070 [Coxiellaceae bacterium]|nr:MAG: hypothetical protein HWD59_09070 [Coxiellaceae bacterium]